MEAETQHPELWMPGDTCWPVTWPWASLTWTVPVLANDQVSNERLLERNALL